MKAKEDRAGFAAWLICATVVVLFLVVFPPGRDLAQHYAVTPLVILFALDPLLALVLVVALSVVVLRLVYELW